MIDTSAIEANVSYEDDNFDDILPSLNTGIKKRAQKKRRNL